MEKIFMNNWMSVFLGMCIIIMWIFLVGFPAMSGATIEHLLFFSVPPAVLTVLWFIGAYFIYQATRLVKNT